MTQSQLAIAKSKIQRLQAFRNLYVNGKITFK